MDYCTAAIAHNQKDWASPNFKAIEATGYDVQIRLDDMDAIDIPALSLLLVKRRDFVWHGLDFCPRAYSTDECLQLGYTSADPLIED